MNLIQSDRPDEVMIGGNLSPQYLPEMETRSIEACSVTRLGDLMDFGQPFIDIWLFFSGHTGSVKVSKCALQSYGQVLEFSR